MILMLSILLYTIAYLAIGILIAYLGIVIKPSLRKEVDILGVTISLWPVVVFILFFILTFIILSKILDLTIKLAEVLFIHE